MAKAKYDKDQAIFLRKIGWSYTDIAEYLGCSESWCKSRLLAVEKDTELMHQSAVIAQMYLKQVKDKSTAVTSFKLNQQTEGVRMYNFEDYPEGFADDVADSMLLQFGADQFMCECCGKDINTRNISDAVNISTTGSHVFCSKDCLIKTVLDDFQISEIKESN